MTLAMVCSRLLLALALVALAASCQRTAATPARARADTWPEIAGSQGAVDILRGAAVDWVRAGGGENLFEEDRVRTFKSAWAQLAFDEGSSLRVDEESLITLGGGITVERGSVAGELQAGLRVKTPALEAESVAPRDIVFQ